MPVKLMMPDGTVSEELYDEQGIADRKNCVYVACGDKKLRVHKDRILPAESAGKLVPIKCGDTLRTSCPICSRVLIVSGATAVCPVHGKMCVVDNGYSNQNAEQEPKMKTDVQTTVDLATIASYGVELWTKPQLKFSDPRTNVQSHVLLIDSPARKLCFNTYNGTLGKKKANVQEFFAQLQLYKDGATTLPGTSVYVLKGTLDQARKTLEKSGYSKL